MTGQPTTVNLVTCDIDQGVASFVEKRAPKFAPWEG